MCVAWVVASTPTASFGLDGKMPQGDAKTKEMAMLLCSPQCKKALTGKDCKAAGWTKDMRKKVPGNCKTLAGARLISIQLTHNTFIRS